MQNTSPILNHYQTWLDDFTRISLWHGLCQQALTQWHRLAMTSCLTPEGTVIVIPQCLLQITHSPGIDACAIVTKITKQTDWPLLSGVLLSECYRLEKRTLAEQLQMLFRSHSPAIRQALTLLCWCELVTGPDMSEWYTLHLRLPDALNQWLAAKQKAYRGLTTMIEGYNRAAQPR
ncbi:secretoglobin family protein [Yersinia kristensenii]|uniref:Secretoglobin family protein n=1 Tax=Yersinia kristensenii TaxID=28152 RepID=A0AB73NL66_YERKR|nr:secretoglobin family protein [Yersinia kristensenii]OVZ79001.1 secretoglobin family protein [Yersinia kristensenii]